MKTYKYFFTLSAIALTTLVSTPYSIQASGYNIINEDEVEIEIKSSNSNIYSNLNQPSISYEKLKDELEKNYKEYNSLLNSSKGKDIICFFGKTGAGKSTLINYLSGNPLIAEEDDIDLSKEMKEKIKKAKEGGSDVPGIMEIGTGDSSTTTRPKYTEIKYGFQDMLLYDFPGFGDTGGAEKDLLSAHFYKNIIEKAQSVRIVFVAGKGEIEDGRGENLKRIIKIAGDLMKESSIKGLSSLVITKVSPTGSYSTIETMGIRIRDKCGNHEVLSEWINKGRLARMLFPQEGEISQEEREPILKAISNTIPAKITNLSLDAMIEGGIGNIMNTLYSSARSKHAIQGQQKESTDNADIDERRLWCLWHKASETDRGHAKKIAKFLRHIEELGADNLLQYLKDLQPRRYETEVKSILDLYIPYDTKGWAAKMNETYEEDREKCWKSLSSKQRDILTRYIFPSKI